jgi:hypothetical protein
MLRSHLCSGPANNELQRTRDGNAAASPLNSVFCGRSGPTQGSTSRCLRRPPVPSWYRHRRTLISQKPPMYEFHRSAKSKMAARSSQGSQVIAGSGDRPSRIGRPRQAQGPTPQAKARTR